jgi:hypothetical protein
MVVATGEANMAEQVSEDRALVVSVITRTVGFRFNLEDRNKPQSAHGRHQCSVTAGSFANAG